MINFVFSSAFDLFLTFVESWMSNNLLDLLDLVDRLNFMFRFQVLDFKFQISRLRFQN